MNTTIIGNLRLSFVALRARRSIIFLVLSLLSVATAQAGLLTFDDLPSLKPLTNGYEGLQWNGFTAVSSANFALMNPPYAPGFLNGLVSESNVVYNTTDPSIINSGSWFDLDSAYLTAVMADTQLEVLGYAGTNLVYDQTYFLTSNAKSLIDFNYQNVSQVVFTGGDFVMDNLSVTPPCQTLQPGFLEFSAPTYAVAEGRPATITVNRVGGSTGPIAVQVATSEGSGLNGVNYTGFTNTLVWLDGQTNAQSVFVQTLQDNTAGDKTVNLSLLNPDGGAGLSYPSNAILTIVDVNYAPGSLEFSSPTYNTLEASSATIMVKRVGGLTGPISVQVVTSDGTGTNGINYIGFTNIIVLADGETHASVVVQTLDDNRMDGNETVNLSLLNPNGGAGLSYPSNAVLTIQDVNSNGDVHFLSPSLVAGVGLELQSTGGVPGANSVLQYATNLCAPITWTPLTTNAADSDGNWTFTVTNLSFDPAQFFRLVPEQ